jgi:hypothetical protein
MPTTEAPYWLKNLIKTVYLKYPDEPKRRGGHLSAILKYARRDALFLILQEMEKEGIDVTPTFAKRIMTEWTGQGADWKSLIKVFGKPGRKADHKSKDFEHLPEIAERWKSQAIKKRDEADQLYRLAVAQVREGLKTEPGPRSFDPIPSREPLGFID